MAVRLFGDSFYLTQHYLANGQWDNRVLSMRPATLKDSASQPGAPQLIYISPCAHKPVLPAQAQTSSAA